MSVPLRINLRQLTRSQLLGDAPHAHRKRIRQLLDDADVSNLVVLESHLGERLFVGVGPNLEHASLFSIVAADFGSFSAVAYYEKTEADSCSAPIRTQSESLRIDELGEELSEFKKRYKLLAEAHQVMQLQMEQLKEASELQAIGFARRDEDLIYGEQLLGQRERSITEMEESLITRMDEHMHKLAQLEQREEELKERERRLQVPSPS